MVREHVFVDIIPAGRISHTKAEHQQSPEVGLDQELHLKHSNNIINHNILLRILLV